VHEVDIRRIKALERGFQFFAPGGGAFLRIVDRDLSRQVELLARVRLDGLPDGDLAGAVDVDLVVFSLDK